MKGLDMFGGREINTRMPGETGIAQAARIRQEKKRSAKVGMIADGIQEAEMRERMMRDYDIRQ